MNFKCLVACALSVAAVSASAAQPADSPFLPAQAIAAVERSARGAKGKFEMVVAATGKNSRATFLNSNPDYRSPGNVTFSLSPAVAAILTKRLGGAPEERLRGKRIVVSGIMEKRPIVNLRYGREHSFNRFSYGVRISRLTQIVSID